MKVHGPRNEMIPKNEPEMLARLAIRRRKAHEEKALLATAEERQRLGSALWSAPLVDLEKPYQRGWFREFELTPEARRRGDVTRLEELLTFVNVVHCCRLGKFRAYDHVLKREAPKRHRLRRFSLSELRKIQFPEHLYPYLRHEAVYQPLSAKWLQDGAARFTGKFVVRFPNHYVSVTKPLIITQRRVDMPRVRSRMQEIENEFDRTNGWGRYLRLRGRSRRRYDCDPPPRERRAEVEDREIRREHDPGRAFSLVAFLS